MCVCAHCHVQKAERSSLSLFPILTRDASARILWLKIAGFTSLSVTLWRARDEGDARCSWGLSFISGGTRKTRSLIDSFSFAPQLFNTSQSEDVRRASTARRMLGWVAALAPVRGPNWFTR